MSKSPCHGRGPGMLSQTQLPSSEEAEWPSSLLINKTVGRGPAAMTSLIRSTGTGRKASECSLAEAASWDTSPCSSLGHSAGDLLRKPRQCLVVAWRALEHERWFIHPFPPREGRIARRGSGGRGSGRRARVLPAASRPANVLRECVLDAGPQRATPFILLLMIANMTAVTHPA